MHILYIFYSQLSIVIMYLQQRTIAQMSEYSSISENY